MTVGAETDEVGFLFGVLGLETGSVVDAVFGAGLIHGIYFFY